MGSKRFEFKQVAQHDDSYCHLSHTKRRLVLRWCFIVSVFLSISIRPCSTFPVGKSKIQRVRQGLKRVATSTALSSSSLASSLPSCIGRLSTSEKVCGTQKHNNSTTRFNFHVIGTSHFRCNSHEEVAALIRQLKPDGVVIELDPERLLRLTLDDATTRLAAMKDTSKNVQDIIRDRWFGGDFLSAIETSKELDIPIFLGDEYPVETQQRFIDTFFDMDSYKAGTLLEAITSLFRPRIHHTIENRSEIVSVDVFGTFLEDPRKLLPLAGTLGISVFAVVILILFDTAGAQGSLPYEAITTFLSLTLSFLASCKVYNNLIVDRDIVLASNVKRAATTTALLKSNQLIRKRWTFSVNEVDDDRSSDQSDAPSSTSIPLFTLKNPLEENAVRNLNLFEPRWLKMIDRLLYNAPHLDSRVGVSGSSGTAEPQIIGCVTCTNKFYSAINANKDNDSSFREGRYADVIFRRRGRFGELVNVVEGSRPSGARKVGAKLVGKEAFDLSTSRDENGNDRISVVEEGYLTASGLHPIDEDETTNEVNVGSIPDEINIVVVVGLLHANGVLDCLLKTSRKAIE